MHSALASVRCYYMENMGRFAHNSTRGKKSSLFEFGLRLNSKCVVHLNQLQVEIAEGIFYTSNVSDSSSMFDYQLMVRRYLFL